MQKTIRISLGVQNEESCYDGMINCFSEAGQFVCETIYHVVVKVKEEVVNI